MEESSAVSRHLEREAIRTREMTTIIGRLIRIRVFLIGGVSTLLLTMLAVEDDGSRTVLLALMVLPLIGIAYFDFRRIGRYRSENVPFDFAIVVTMQTLVICLTGGVESPLLYIYVVVSIASGIALGKTRGALILIGWISTLIWTVAILGLVGLIPKTVPDLLDVGPGHVERTTYVVATVVVLNLLVVGVFRIGVLIHETTNRMLDAAIDARQSALETLSSRNAELIHLSSAIAHELKNPLASVQGLVQLLKRGDKNSSERLEVLEREVSRMRDTLDDFLNFSRPLGDLTVERIDVRELMNELTALHDGLTESRRIAVVPAEGGAGSISGDRRKLQQALVNLLQNAIEATPEGGTIEWIATERDGAFEVGVADSGPGIDPAILEYLSGGRSTTTKPSGSGIGLQVVRTIAEQHGGSLILKNRAAPRCGCRAVLRLPKEKGA